MSEFYVVDIVQKLSQRTHVRCPNMKAHAQTVSQPSDKI